MAKRLPFEYAIRNLGRSYTRLISSVLGSFLVVTLVIAAGAFIRGMERSMYISAGQKNVMLMGAGSEESVERSELGMSVPTQLAASVNGIRERLGIEYISPEVHMAIVLRTDAESKAELQGVLRGVTPAAMLVHPQVKLTSGHMPRMGYNEVMVGALAATRLGVDAAKLAVGQRLWFADRYWTIAGHFTAPHSVMDAEIWVPLTDLQVAARRDTLSCVIATLDQATLDDVRIWAAQRLDLEIVAMAESAYYDDLLRFYGPVRAMVWVTAALIALGGLFGGLNTMYAAFASRIRELGTLQTLGFSRLAIAMSFLQESLVAASAGSLIATATGVFLIHGIAVRFSMGAFALVVDAPVVLLGLAGGLTVAAIGIMPPLWRCLRLPIPEALRAS
ncbi:MAG: ABC transporter permease [Phycisphaerae bacterium]